MLLLSNAKKVPRVRSGSQRLRARVRFRHDTFFLNYLEKILDLTGCTFFIGGWPLGSLYSNYFFIHFSLLIYIYLPQLHVCIRKNLAWVPNIEMLAKLQQIIVNRERLKNGKWWKICNELKIDWLLQKLIETTRKSYFVLPRENQIWDYNVKTLDYQILSL